MMNLMKCLQDLVVITGSGRLVMELRSGCILSCASRSISCFGVIVVMTVNLGLLASLIHCCMLNI